MDFGFPLLLILSGAPFGGDILSVDPIAPPAFWAPVNTTVYQRLTSSWESQHIVSATSGTAWESLVAPPVGTSVQQSSATAYESLQGDAVSDDVGWESFLGVQQTLQTPYEAGGSAITSLTTPWESTQPVTPPIGVQQTLAAAWEALGYVTAFDDSPAWESLIGVQPDATFDSAWEALGFLSNTDLVPWEGAGLTVGQFLAAWEALNAQGSTINIGDLQCIFEAMPCLDSLVFVLPGNPGLGEIA